MINTSVVLVAIISHLMAVMSPGPDFVVAVRNSLVYSRKTAIYTALGFALGIGVHLLYGIFGLALIIQQSDVLFSVIKYLGALYLFYLGISIVRNKQIFTIEKYKTVNYDLSAGKAIASGFLTNVLNPKASLFFLSLLTYILKTKPSDFTLIVISFFMILNTFLWFCCVALFFNIEKVRILYQNYQKYIMITLSAVLILLAILMLLYKK